jgi:hypothetical protein
VRLSVEHAAEELWMEEVPGPLGQHPREQDRGEDRACRARAEKALTIAAELRGRV